MSINTLDDPTGDLRVGLICKLYRIERAAGELMRRRTHGGAARMFRRFNRIGKLWAEYRRQLSKLDELRQSPQRSASPTVDVLREQLMAADD
jgi:hypothetical protein